MKRRLAAAVGAATAMLCLSVSSPALAEGSAVIIVKSRDASVVTAGTGATVAERIDERTVKITVPNQTTDSAVARFEARPDVEWAEPVIKYHAAKIPNDPCYRAACLSNVKQYNAQLVGAPAAWDKTTGSDITVAVLDSGVDATHPEFGKRVILGPNYIGGLNVDDNGHGTHVAGILAAQGDNNAGIAGLAWNVRVLSVKVLDRYGSGDVDDIAKGIRYATDNGSRIINLSLVGAYSDTVREAIAYAEARGVLVVAAAGNHQYAEDVTAMQYPAAFDGVVAVGATDNRDALASYSYRGRWVDIVAPGNDIVSTWSRSAPEPSQYEIDSGTSMSAPMVAGVAALLWSYRPYLSADAVLDRLMATSTRVSASGSGTASGRLDAAAALGDAPAGYRMAASDGGIFAFNASFDGSTGSIRLNQPITAMMASGNTGGYWLVARDGGVFNFNAPFFGSAGGLNIPAPFSSATATRSGGGYWLVTTAGHVYGFGDAVNYGQASGLALNSPIVSIVATASGRGYWLFAADGGIFSYGDARFYGSTGSLRLNRPIVGAARTASGNGYWMVASDGGIFSFGDAVFHGSTGSLTLNQPVVAMTPTSSGKGYWLIASDGGIFNYGDARFLGSTGHIRLNQPVITGAALP